MGLSARGQWTYGMRTLPGPMFLDSCKGHLRQKGDRYLIELNSKMPRLYSDPSIYDMIHADGTDEDVYLLDELAGRHGNGGKSAFFLGRPALHNSPYNENVSGLTCTKRACQYPPSQTTPQPGPLTGAPELWNIGQGPIV